MTDTRASDELSINTIRTLAMDVVQAANSSHPGTPNAMAPMLLPDVAARVAVEQASTFGWEHHIGLGGAIIGMRTLGASAPLRELQKKFGFTPDRLMAAAKEQLVSHAR